MSNLHNTISNVTRLKPGKNSWARVPKFCLTLPSCFKNHSSWWQKKTRWTENFRALSRARVCNRLGTTLLYMLVDCTISFTTRAPQYSEKMRNESKTPHIHLFIWQSQFASGRQASSPFPSSAARSWKALDSWWLEQKSIVLRYLSFKPSLPLSLFAYTNRIGKSVSPSWFAY